MVYNSLRTELTALLTSFASARPPAVRRSLQEEWLYSTDLPVLLSGNERRRLLEALSELGWEYTEDGFWILLRKHAAEPPKNWFDGDFGPEASCCLSLLKRHPKTTDHMADMTQCALIKAGEQGTKAMEDTCRNLHHDWAERLRQREMLPAVSRKYFGI